MSSRSLWRVGWMGLPGSAGGQSLGNGAWQRTLGQKALRRSAVGADVRTTTEQRGGVRASRNWEMRTLYKHGREQDMEQVCGAGG